MKIYRIVAVIGIFLTILSILTYYPSTVRTQYEHHVTLDESIFQLDIVPDEIRAAIIKSIMERDTKIMTNGTYFVVGVFDQYDEWAYGSIGAAYGNIPPNWYDSVLFIAYRDEDGKWLIALENSKDYDIMISTAYRQMSKDVATRFLPLRDLIVMSPVINDLKFPWSSSQVWRYTSSWHEGSSLDFASVNVRSEDQWFLSSSDGYSAITCGNNALDPHQASIRVSNNVIGDIGYSHLNATTIQQEVINRNISQGQQLGRAYDGNVGQGYYDIEKSWPWPSCTPNSNNSCNWNNRTGCCFLQYKTNCGGGTGAHFHWTLPSRDVTVDGWAISTDGIWRKGSEQRGVGSTFSSTNWRPGSGVVLFGRTGNSSAQLSYNTASSWSNVPSNFSVNGLGVAFNWAAVLYSGSTYQSSACITLDGSAFNLDAYRFSDNSPVVGRVRSVQVFRETCPGVCNSFGMAVNAMGELEVSSPQGVCSTSLPPSNRAPNTPTLRGPGDWHVARDGRAPELCWHNHGDPDGDSVQFYAEVYGSAVNANSGWSNNTCWRPSSLDGRYHTYQWRVKARDGRGLESGWSSTWRFTIEQPNQPPVISFNTANGSSASRIETRTRDWTFQGTASDPENRLNRVEFRCAGDNCGSGPSQTGGGSWSLTRTGVSGRNVVHFVAVDDMHSVASRSLELLIDLAAPTTVEVDLNGRSPANLPQWFTQAVTVRLRAQDNGTGGARVGVQEIRYRVDGGGWQAQTGDTASFTVSADGQHTLEYYAVDRVGNQEAVRSVSFRIDKTPPTAIGGVSETHGVTSNVWQKGQNTPTFTWNASSDATSGLWGYQFYFGTDANGEGYHSITASEPRQWTPQPGGVRTGTYYLRGRTRDNAGNYSAWATLFTFRYDGTPPQNPKEASHAAGIKNGVWQRTSNTADFTWPPAHDEGSGIKGYLVYWGADDQGISTDFITASNYQNGTALCGADDTCSGYLRLRSVDNVDHQAEEWSTAFVLRYDNTPPTVSFTINGGAEQTTQTLIKLNIDGQDEGSGVKEMRVSGDGVTWTAWEVYAAERLWVIPGISRQTWPVYVQVRDGVGLTSEVATASIYLDVNAQQPRSAGYRLFDYAMVAGGGTHESQPLGYRGHSSVGQVMDSPRSYSSNYTLTGGYQAGSQALPLIVPDHDEYQFINGIFASGTGATTLTSPLYQLRGTLGEPALPSNQTTIASAAYQHQPGFLAADRAFRQTPGATLPPGPPFEPEPEPACEFPTISINQAALFTNDPQVTLSICAPNAEAMKLSNDGGFGEAEWEPYVETRSWTLAIYGQQVLPRFVYAAFRDKDGRVHGVYFDDIIYDPHPPEGAIMVGDSVPGGALAQVLQGQAGEAAAVFELNGVRYIQRLDGTSLSQPLALVSAGDEGAVEVFIHASDDNSGVEEMQLGASASFTGTEWTPFSALASWQPAGGDGIKTLYARFRDSAGNVSEAALTEFVLDTLPPIGGIALSPMIVGPDVITTTIYLGAEDNLSGVAEMRISEDPEFGDAPWRLYEFSVTWPIAAGIENGTAVYVQYRDWAGNVSEVYSDSFVVDNEPPVVYVEVEPGLDTPHTMQIWAYDELSNLDTLYLSNDPWFIAGVVSMPYTDTVQWEVDDRRVVWVWVKDGVGNVSEPYPAYAAAAHFPQAPGAVNVEAGPAGLRIAWQHLAVNTSYEVWRDTTPYFDPDNPGATTLRLAEIDAPEGGAVTYTDEEATQGTYYYLVRGVNVVGETSLASTGVGVFRINLAPGAALLHEQPDHVVEPDATPQRFFLPWIVR